MGKNYKYRKISFILWKKKEDRIMVAWPKDLWQQVNRHLIYESSSVPALWWQDGQKK